jgi:hypothetical protein
VRRCSCSTRLRSSGHSEPGILALRHELAIAPPRRATAPECGGSRRPDRGWVARPVFELDLRDRPVLRLIHDRDSKFSAAFNQVSRTEGVTVTEDAGPRHERERRVRAARTDSISYRSSPTDSSSASRELRRSIHRVTSGRSVRSRERTSQAVSPWTRFGS